MAIHQPIAKRHPAVIEEMTFLFSDSHSVSIHLPSIPSQLVLSKHPLIAAITGEREEGQVGGLEGGGQVGGGQVGGGQEGGLEGICVLHTMCNRGV